MKEPKPSPQPYYAGAGAGRTHVLPLERPDGTAEVGTICV